MSKTNRVISFGASITFGSELPSPDKTWAGLIANKLNKKYLCLAEPAASNTSILRQILSFDQYENDLILVMWTSTTRYEFKTQDSWTSISPWSEQSGFTAQWYKGPGFFEYTEVLTTMKEILLAKQFIESKKLQYIFVFDSNELTKSFTWIQNDNLISSMKKLMPWDNIIWFDDTGFIDWSKEKGYKFIGTHPGVEAHTNASNYILSKTLL